MGNTLSQKNKNTKGQARGCFLDCDLPEEAKVSDAQLEDYYKSHKASFFKELTSDHIMDLALIEGDKPEQSVSVSMLENVWQDVQIPDTARRQNTLARNCLYLLCSCM